MASDGVRNIQAVVATGESPNETMKRVLVNMLLLLCLLLPSTLFPSTVLSFKVARTREGALFSGHSACGSMRCWGEGFHGLP